MTRWWPLAVLLVLELGALALLSLRGIDARTSGVEITLRTVAVDPWDPLAGRYVVLRYAVEEPFDTEQDFADGDTVWIRVGRGLPAWERTDVTRTPGPTNGRQASLRATWRRGAPRLESATRLYLPEEECLEADARIREHGSDNRVDLAVGESGVASPLRLHVAGHTFGER